MQGFLIEYFFYSVAQYFCLILVFVLSIAHNDQWQITLDTSKSQKGAWWAWWQSRRRSKWQSYNCQTESRAISWGLKYRTRPRSHRNELSNPWSATKHTELHWQSEIGWGWGERDGGEGERDCPLRTGLLWKEEHPCQENIALWFSPPFNKTRLSCPLAPLLSG